jgi:opacity protein-like surface antigen
MKKGFKMASWHYMAGAAALCASQAFAQSMHFEGLSLGANVSSVQTDPKRMLNGVSATDKTDSTDGDFQLQYAWGLGNQFAVGLGATAGAGTLKAGNFGSSEYLLKDRFSIDLLPGFALSDSTLLFGKLSYLAATATEKLPGSELSATLSGMGYGVGLRALMDKNWYVQATYDIHQYNEKQISPITSLKPEAYLFSLGAGYKF